MSDLNKKDEVSVNKYINMMFDIGFSESDIKLKLINDYGFTQYEANTATDRMYKVKLAYQIKRGLLITLCLLILTLVLWFLFFYFKHKEEEFAELRISQFKGVDLGNGKTLLTGSFNNFKMFGHYTVYSGIATLASFFRVAVNWFKYKKLE